MIGNNLKNNLYIHIQTKLLCIRQIFRKMENYLKVISQYTQSCFFILFYVFKKNR